MPTAGFILLAIAVLLAVLSARRYARVRRVDAQLRTWLIVAAIFTVVAVVTGVT